MITLTLKVEDSRSNVTKCLELDDKHDLNKADYNAVLMDMLDELEQYTEPTF